MSTILNKTALTIAATMMALTAASTVAQASPLMTADLHIVATGVSVFPQGSSDVPNDNATWTGDLFINLNSAQTLSYEPGYTAYTVEGATGTYSGTDAGKTASGTFSLAPFNGSGDTGSSDPTYNGSTLDLGTVSNVTTYGDNLVLINNTTGAISVDPLGLVFEATGTVNPGNTSVAFDIDFHATSTALTKDNEVLASTTNGSPSGNLINGRSATITLTEVPEPTSLALIGGGLFLAGAFRRRRQAAAI